MGKSAFDGLLSFFIKLVTIIVLTIIGLRFGLWLIDDIAEDPRRPICRLYVSETFNCEKVIEELKREKEEEDH